MSEHIFSVIMNEISSSFSPFIRKLYIGSLYTVSVHHIIRVEAGRTLLMLLQDQRMVMTMMMLMTPGRQCWAACK